MSPRERAADCAFCDGSPGRGGRWDPMGGSRFQATPDGVRIGAVWWSGQSEEDTIPVAVAVVLALAIAARDGRAA
jgi:hypothetical protein